MTDISATRRALNSIPAFAQMPRTAWDFVAEAVGAHFGASQDRTFSPADGWFIGAWMAAVRPQSIIAHAPTDDSLAGFIQSVADLLGLTPDGKPIVQALPPSSPIAGPVLGYIGDNPLHPGASLALTDMHHSLPSGSWVLVRNPPVVISSDAADFASVIPASGARVALAHWPGRKLFGVDACARMAAVQLDIDANALRRFKREIQTYPCEPADLMVSGSS